MITGSENINKHYLFPGKIFFSKKPHVVDTILGSCVAVFLWDCVLRFGSISHYMLPLGNEDGVPSFKYGNTAIAELLKRMLEMGSSKENIKAKIFGGSVIGKQVNSAFNIGERNIIIACDILKKEQIPIVSYSVGGKLGRKVIFHSCTGDVLISYIKHGSNITVEQNNNKLNPKK